MIVENNGNIEKITKELIDWKNKYILLNQGQIGNKELNPEPSNSFEKGIDEKNCSLETMLEGNNDDKIVQI